MGGTSSDTSGATAETTFRTPADPRPGHRRIKPGHRRSTRTRAAEPRPLRKTRAASQTRHGQHEHCTRFRLGINEVLTPRPPISTAETQYVARREFLHCVGAHSRRSRGASASTVARRPPRTRSAWARALLLSLHAVEQGLPCLAMGAHGGSPWGSFSCRATPSAPGLCRAPAVRDAKPAASEMLSRPSCIQRLGAVFSIGTGCGNPASNIPPDVESISMRASTPSETLGVRGGPRQIAADGCQSWGESGRFRWCISKQCWPSVGRNASSLGSQG